MNHMYCQALISAENKAEANKIIDVLLEKKLIAGGLISNAPCRFWWKGKIMEMEYYNISAFTITAHKEAIIAEVKKQSKEEVPIIAFSAMDGNREFLEWIRETVVDIF